VYQQFISIYEGIKYWPMAYQAMLEEGKIGGG
jgi:hypothetical protein